MPTRQPEPPESRGRPKLPPNDSTEHPAVEGNTEAKFKRSEEATGWPDPTIIDFKDLNDAELANYIEVSGSNYDGVGPSLREAIVRVLRRSQC